MMMVFITSRCESVSALKPGIDRQLSVNFRRFGWAGSVISVSSVWFGSVLAFTDNLQNVSLLHENSAEI